MKKNILLFKRVLSKLPFPDFNELTSIVQYLIACSFLYVVYIKSENRYALMFLILLIIAECCVVLKDIFEHVTEDSSDKEVILYPVIGLSMIALITGVTLSIAHDFAMTS